MRSVVSLAACALTLGLLGPAKAAVLGGPIVNPLTGNVYYLLSANTWIASQSEAVSLGGNLATINDAAEDSWVFQTFSFFGGSSRNLWIGLTDAVQEGRFAWVGGEAVTYTNFGPGEPNNFGNEDYVVILGQNFPPLFAGQWNDNPSDSFAAYGSRVHGLVEVVAVPESGTSVLFSIGLLALWFRTLVGRVTFEGLRHRIV